MKLKLKGRGKNFIQQLANQALWHQYLIKLNTEYLAAPVNMKIHWLHLTPEIEKKLKLYDKTFHHMF